jgi:hypothetical protein
MTRILTIIALLFATPLWADEEESRREMLEMADGFARCAGVFKVMALSSSGSGKNFSAKQDKQLANGAEVASWFLAGSMGRKHASKRAAAIIDTEFTTWMALLETNPQALADLYQPKYESCIANLPMQEAIINMARDKVYDQ